MSHHADVALRVAPDVEFVAGRTPRLCSQPTHPNPHPATHRTYTTPRHHSTPLIPFPHSESNSITSNGLDSRLNCPNFRSTTYRVPNAGSLPPTASAGRSVMGKLRICARPSPPTPSTPHPHPPRNASRSPYIPITPSPQPSHTSPSPAPTQNSIISNGLDSCLKGPALRATGWSGQLPGGTRTRWNTPPYHGTFGPLQGFRCVKNAVSGLAVCIDLRQSLIDLCPVGIRLNRFPFLGR